MAAGDWKNIVVGADMHGAISQVAAGNVVTFTMTATNNAWCGRFMADSAKDIKSVLVSFSAISSPGTITCRIETVDTTSGKPTGSLYDANATKQFTPTTGTNTITFDSLPTTGLTAGTEYAIVLIKDNAATTCTLRARVNGTSLPSAVLTATDGSTRSNFAEVSGSCAICCVIDEDDAYRAYGFCPAPTNNSFLIHGSDRVAAFKVVTTVELSLKAITGVSSSILSRVGTPAGDLRCRILNTSNSVVSSMTWTVDKDSLTNANLRGFYLPTNGLVSLPAGTYRIAFDSASSANSSNCFGIRYAELFHSSFHPNNWCFSESTDASTSFTWTDTATRTCTFGFAVDDVVAAAGGSAHAYGSY